MGGLTRPCPGCGTPVDPTIKFCGQCGRDLRDTTAPESRTAMGIPVVATGEAPPPAEPPTRPARPAAGSRRDNRTMLGMTAPAQAEEPAPAAPAKESEQPPAPTPVKPVPTSNRTMLGMPASKVSAEHEEETPHAGTVPAATTNRTMLGMPAQRASSSYPPPALPVHGQRGRAPVRYPGDEDLDSGSYPPPRRGLGTGAIVGILVALVLLATVLGVGAYLLLGRGGGDVRASVVQGEEGEQLRIEVPRAEPGTKVRFAGEERAIESGVASFPLSADALQVGDNELVVDVIGPDGDVDQSEITLSVKYRVRADLTGLTREPPSFDVVVDAAPGSEVTLDGEPLALDGDGHAQRSYPLGEPASGATAYERTMRYRVKLPAGTPEEGTVRVRVPYAQMQLDRPGTDVLTDREEIEIAGAVHAQATVTIDGTAVPVRAGRFVHRYPLPEPGEHTPRIVTQQAGRAPRVTTIRIRRVEDMAREAAAFEPDPGMTYARVSQNPRIYRGQKIAVEGRVYNVNVEGGRSDVQILVRDCPRGQRCPLWVSYPAATEVTVDDWVRVLGTVGGEQQFRSETNRVISVPRVDAQFVLPVRR